MFADRTKESGGGSLSTAVQKVVGTRSREKQTQVLLRNKRVRAQTLLCDCVSYSVLSATQGNASCSGTRAQPAGLPGICCSLGIAMCFPMSGLIHSNMCPPSSYPQAGSSSCIPHAPLGTWSLSVHLSTPLCSCHVSPYSPACFHEQRQLRALRCSCVLTGVQLGDPSLPFQHGLSGDAGLYRSH